MKIAFLIMVRNNPTMLNCFIKQLLQYQGSVVFIHVDEKGLNIIPDIIEDPRVIIIPEHYNGSWGDYSQIQMVNALIKNAVNSGDFDYYSLHSGVDLCVREVSEFADYLSKNNLYGFYECTKLPSTWQYGGGLGRVALKWPKYLRRRAVGYQLPRVLRAIYGRLFSVGIIKGRKIPEKYELFGGSAWFTIRSDCAKDYVHFLEDSEFTSLFVNALCGDEIYYVSIFQMCKGNRMVNNKSNLRFIDWKERGQHPGPGSPNTIDCSMIDEIEKSGCFFARKFDANYDNDVIQYFLEKTSSN